MTISLNKLDANTNTFGDWLFKTNEIIDALANVVVTIDSSQPIAGDISVDGVLEANTLIVGDISGKSNNNLVFNSPVEFNSNVFFNGLTNNLGAANNYIMSGSNSTHFILAANTSSGRLRFTQIDFTNINAINITAGTLNPARLSGDYPGITGVGNLSSGSISSFGNINIGSNIFTGDGSGLTNLNANNVTTGTVPITRLGTGTANTTNFLRGDGVWSIPVGNTNLSASATSTSLTVSSSTGTGTTLPVASNTQAGIMIVGDQRFSGNKIFEGNVTINGQIIGPSVTGDGSGLTNLNANTITSGTISDGRISGTYTGVRFLGVNGTPGAPTYSFGSAPSMGMFFVNSTTLGFSINATTRLTLDEIGNIVATGDITAFSDERLKNDVKTIENALDTISLLRGVSYTRVDSEQKGIGVIAQEVQEVVPEVVHDNDEFLSVSYGNLAGLFIEAIKELKFENEQLKIRITKLEEKI